MGLLPRPQGMAGEDLLKAAVVVGGIALGILALKYLLEGDDDED